MRLSWPAPAARLLLEDRLADAETRTGERYDLVGADFAPLVPEPSKIICVGHNYTNHILEMGRELPSHPTLFTKFADTLLGANDPIIKPVETEARLRCNANDMSHPWVKI